MTAPRHRRVLGLLAVLGAVAAISLYAVGAKGAEYAATAIVSPHATYLNDPAGTTFTFTVTNTGAVANIGAVEIRRPDGTWAVTACQGAPAGWTAQRSDPMCRFRSASGAADDIAPGASRTFQVAVATAPGAADRPGTFAVTVSKSNQFDNPSQLTAALAAPGDLVITAHTFQILDAVIAAASATPGTACPAANKTGSVDALVTVVICGRNRSTGAQTPSAAFSSLSGTLLSSSGTFSSGSIPANSASSVVLGSWSGAQIRTLGGTGLTIVALIAADATHTSPSTTLGGYIAFNTQPDAVDDAYTTGEEVPLAVPAPGVLDNDSDADGHALTATLETDVANGDLTFAANGSFSYDPADQFEGDDSFTYSVDDGHGGTDTATVTITVEGVNDPPTSIDQSYGTAVGNTLFAVSRPLTSGPVAHAAGNLLDGSADIDSATLTVVPGTVATSGGGSATLFADGTFTYISEVGETATSDTFTYVVDDGEGGQAAPATVTITLSGDLVWYVDNSGGAGDGRSTSPFASFGLLQGGVDVDGPNQTIFVFEGSGSYGGGIVLESGQRLLGQPAGLVMGAQTLLVAGTGSRPTITNAVGHGITLANGNTISSVAVNGADLNGVWGTSITGSTITDIRLTGNGTDPTTPGSGIQLDDPHGMVSIADSVVSGSKVDNVRITTSTGSVTIDIADTELSDTDAISGAHGLRLLAGGSSAVTATVDGVTFDGNRIYGLQALTSGTATVDLDVTGSTFTSNFVGIDLVHAGTGSLTATVNDNDFSSTLAAPGTPINVFLSASAGSGAGSILGATISNNTISNNGSGNAPGIWYHTGTSAGHARLALSGNIISGVTFRGIALEAGPGSSTLDASVSGNAVTVGAGGLEGIYVAAGTISADTVAICAHVSGNTVASPGSDIRVRQRFLGTTLRLPGYAGAGTDDGAVAAFLLAQNTATDALATHQSVAGFSGGAACVAP